jgi:hypothetical protein
MIQNHYRKLLNAGKIVKKDSVSYLLGYWCTLLHNYIHRTGITEKVQPNHRKHVSTIQHTKQSQPTACDRRSSAQNSHLEITRFKF